MRVVFLWHMHQPMYGLTAEKRRRYPMPWTFVHGIREYYDMAEMARRMSARVTFNLVPSLLLQLEEYAEGKAQDLWINRFLKPAEELSQAEKEFLKANFFALNPETFIKPFPRFSALWQRRRAPLSADEFRDLQVFWLLSQLSALYHREDPRVKRLVEKGGGFSEQDKAEVYGIAIEIIRKVLTLYRQLSNDGAVEVSTSPFFHPILPLLIDSRIARISMPDAPMPERHFAHPEDAKLHLLEAFRFMESRGYHVSGMWPSEGSVSDDAIRLMSEVGIKWAATDEGILRRSGGDNPYRIYSLHGVKLVFRDHGLSDAIGFTYQKWPADKAVEDFIAHLREIEASFGEDAVVSVILDGENPWPGYPDGGIDLIEKLYGALENSFQLVTPSDMADEESEELRSIHPGSWIRSDFSMWIGNPEKNQAWELLSEMRSSFGSLSSIDDPDSFEFMAAEGSDWFWWYGDDGNPYGTAFDELFRQHLTLAFRLRGIEPPHKLEIPIKKGETRIFRPSGRVHPRLDGKVSSYFEWLYSGSIDFVRDEISTMMPGEQLLRGLEFGFDEDGNLYLMLQGASPMSEILKNRTVRFGIDEVKVEVSEYGAAIRKNGADEQLKFAVKDVLELEVPKKFIGDKKEFELHVELVEGESVIERHPISGSFVICSEPDDWAV